MIPTPSHGVVGAYLRGLCMGAADVVPGVSGGTIAFITGIYERLLQAIQSFNAQWLQLMLRGAWRQAFTHTDMIFLIPLGLGILSALFFFTRVVPLHELITTHPELVYGLFFGLILASIVVLLHSARVFTGSNPVWLIIGILSGFALVNLVPVQTPDALWFIFLCGALAISAMILPGISGSFILLILQKYSYIFSAIGRLDLTILVPFALGIGCGLMLFSRVLNWLLGHFHHQSLSTIIGILIGSLWMIWPFQDRHYIAIHGKQKLLSSTPVWPEQLDQTVLVSLALALAGILAVSCVHFLARISRQNPENGS